MARRPTPDRSIGERIKARRNLHGWSIRFAADRAGISHTTWGRIEKGEVSADNRFTLAAIAEALRCSVAELTGLPASPVDDATTAAQAAVYDVRSALIEIDLAEGPTAEILPIQELAREADLVADLRAKCDYAGSASRLPILLRQLHAATKGPDRVDALKLLTLTADQASLVVRYVGYPGESWLAAERSHQAAIELEDPVMLAVAAYSRAHAASGCSLWNRSLTLADRGIADLEPYIGEPAAPEMLGQLHLTAAYDFYAMGQVDNAAERIATAQELADRTGDTTTLRMSFGPSNIRFWLVSMEVDGGDPGKAVEIARATNPSAVPSVSRQTAFYLDTAKALARIGHDQAAVRMLARAERLAPQRVRASVIAAETVRTLLERAQRNTVGSELKGFAERMGILE
jgi:transcriptional regulator with XRE-family HTH domain